MGAKRAVAGRSMPYDMLLAAYQKKNQSREDSTEQAGFECDSYIANIAI